MAWNCGTTMVQNIAPDAASSDPQQLLINGNTLYFTADDNTVGRELWAMALDATSIADGQSPEESNGGGQVTEDGGGGGTISLSTLLLMFAIGYARRPSYRCFADLARAMQRYP